MIIAKILAVSFFVYAIFCAYLYFFQEKQLFSPPGKSQNLAQIPAKNKISFNIHNIKLNGITSGNITNEKPVVIYFGGNAEDVFYNFVDFSDQLNAQFVAFNYRGFAGNEGKPTVKAFINDAEAILNKMIAEYSLDPKNIILMGRSFGSAIAVQLSKTQTTGGVILISPFDSLSNIAKRYFPWIPVSLLLKHPLDSLEIAKQARLPLLIVAAEVDHIIPLAYSENLFNAWASKQKKMIIIEGAGHNSIQGGDRYFSTINQFVASAIGQRGLLE